MPSKYHDDDGDDDDDEGEGVQTTLQNARYIRRVRVWFAVVPSQHQNEPTVWQNVMRFRCESLKVHHTAFNA